LRIFHHRPEQVLTAYLVVIAVKRCGKPRLLQQGVQAIRQLRTAAHRTRQSVKVCQQILPYRIHIPFIAPGQHGDIALALLQQFQQPVLRVDFRMGAGLAQGSCGSQRFCAVRVKSSQQDC